MGKFWGIDLRHYLLPDGNPVRLPPPGQRLFDYWAEIVSHATQDAGPTTLRCRQRLGRRRCGTVLTISFEIGSNDIIWFCPHCRDEGRIVGWQGTLWDNTRLV